MVDTSHERVPMVRSKRVFVEHLPATFFIVVAPRAQRLWPGLFSLRFAALLRARWLDRRL
jgi:hypothetical protein